MSPLQTHLSHPKYRPDIDGLRALAVLSVVLFHGFPERLSGGFIGVDVFFVISGFLISMIIFENLDRGTFNFWEFYARRIKRIFPALFLVLAASYAFGWFTLLADEYQQLGKHIAAGAGFVANFALLEEAGYFDTTAEAKPLLHLWSLGIEEQFYLVWPFVLWFAWKKKYNLLTLTLIVAAISFLLNLKGIRKDAVETFYSPQTRFWELLCGSLLAWIALYRKDAVDRVKARIDSKLHALLRKDVEAADGKTLSDVLSLVGLLSLILGFVFLDKSNRFPGAWAALPVLGAALIIFSGPNAWINRTILSSRIAVWFGVISFPLYLWHWPLLSFAKIVDSEASGYSHAAVFLMIAASVGLAWLTYAWIERPIRFGGFKSINSGLMLLPMLGVGLVGFFTYKSDGISWRASNEKFHIYNQSIKISKRKDQCFEIPYAHKKDGDWYCELGMASAKAKYFAYGDSHALNLIPALEKFAHEKNTKILFAGSSGCPSLLGIQSLRGRKAMKINDCRALNERIYNHVKASGIKNVILINRWVYYTGSASRPDEFNPIARKDEISVDKSASARNFAWAVQHTVSRYKEIGVNVIFVEDIPQQLHEPKAILRKGQASDEGYNSFSVKTDEHRRNQQVVNQILGAQESPVLKFDELLCEADRCPLVINSRFLYFDDDHLSVDGALHIYPLLSKGLAN